MWTFLSPLKKNTKALLTRKVTTVFRNEAIIKVPIKNGQISNNIFFHKLVTRSFEKKQIFQEEQKTIFAIIKPVLGIFF